MTNTNIQGVIPVAGRGHVKKPNGSYKSGEYKNLVNCEINENGQIVNRRNISSAIKSVGNTFTDFLKPLGVIGNWRQRACILNVGSMEWVSKSSAQVTGALHNADLPQPASPGWHRFLGYLEYNQRHYFISLKYDPAATTTKYQIIVHYTAAASTADPATLIYTDLTHATVISTADVVEFKNFFVFKDRLFITTSNFVYFSKATDPSIFDTPYGGFIGFESKGLIKEAVALKDTIYVLMDASVYLVTFGIDPNTDLQIRLISDNAGGDSICLYDDIPYFVRDNYLYAISNTSVSRVLDLQLDFNNSGQEVSRLTSFGDYIILTREQFKTYDAIGGAQPDSANPAHMFGGHYAPAGTYDATDSDATRYHVFFINMINGAVHVLDFRDWINESFDLQGYISNFFYVSYEDVNNDLWMYFYTYRKSGSDIYSHPYAMSINKTDFSNSEDVIDVASQHNTPSANSVASYVRHKITTEIDSYVPDGSEYMMKRFRNLLLQGIVPNENFTMEFAFDNGNYSPAISVVQPTYLGRPPYPFRVPINQRARTLSLRMRSVGYTQPAVGKTDILQVDDLRVLWTYTARGPINKAQDAVLS